MGFGSAKEEGQLVRRGIVKLKAVIYPHVSLGVS